MRGPILNESISSKMEIAEIVEYFFIPPKDQIRYRIKMYKTFYNAIPIINNTTVYKPGDKVIVMFKNANVEDTPFIVGKFNQMDPEESLLISSIPEIKPPEDRRGIKYETDYSVFKMDSTRKRITIGNKNSGGEIIIDNNTVIIGDINLTEMMNNFDETINKRLNDTIVSSKKNIIFDIEQGNAITSAKEVNFISNNFVIKNSSEMLIETEHVNFSSSFVEFSVVTPKAYNLLERRAYSFFAVDGDFDVSLGKGDFRVATMLPVNYIELLVSPLSDFSGTESSFSGLGITPFGVELSYAYGANNLEIGPNYYNMMIGGGSMFLETFSAIGGLYNISILSGQASMTLTPSGFFVTISGNTLSFTAEGLTISSGSVTTLAGDVQAMGGTYSLIRHMHPTAIPGGPSPPLPL